MRVGGKSRKSRSVKLPRIKLIPLKLCLWPSVTIFSFSDKSREHHELSYLSSQTMAILSHCFSLLNRSNCWTYKTSSKSGKPPSRTDSRRRSRTHVCSGAVIRIYNFVVL